MSEPLYAILNGHTEFAIYQDSRVPHPVRRVVKDGELVQIFGEAKDGGMCDCELADGTVIRTHYLNLTVLPYVAVGNEVVFTTPKIRHATGTESEQRRSGTIIAVLTGRQFGRVLVQGGEPNAYQVPVLDIIYGE